MGNLRKHLRSNSNSRQPLLPKHFGTFNFGFLGVSWGSVRFKTVREAVRFYFHLFLSKTCFMVPSDVPKTQKITTNNNYYGTGVDGNKKCSEVHGSIGKSSVTGAYACLSTSYPTNFDFRIQSN